MAISLEHLRDFARKHASKHSDEVTLRAASSRSYYAAFHVLHSFAAQLPRSRKCPAGVTHVSHTELLERLSEWRTESIGVDLSALIPLKKKMLTALASARTDRVRADCNMGAEVGLKEVAHQIDRVRRIIDAVIKINNEVSRLRGAGSR